MDRGGGGSARPRPAPGSESDDGGGERIIDELRGLACLPLELMPARRKGCAVTRSFARRILKRETLEQAVSAQATRLGEKLRRGRVGTTHVSVF